MGEEATAERARGLPFGTRMGRYSLIRRLAVGGMAELYVARQGGIEGFEKIVALKRVLPHLAENPEFVQMFLAEARIAASLDHPNIAHVTDIGEEDGEYFFAMEYVHGANLLEVLRRSDEVPLSRACALTVVSGVAAALHYAHEQLGPDGRPLGLVHRDVSPSNVMLSHTGAVKLTDFGIVRAAARTSVTAEGQTKGKAGYMSPEQCRGDRLDRRSDIFALGILLYETTLGVRAFYAPNNFAILGRIARADYIPPHEIDPEFPASLARVIDRAMAKEPEDRFVTAEAMQLELEEIAHAEGLRPSTVELARHMKSLFGSPAHPHTDLGSLRAPGPEPTAVPPVVATVPSPVVVAAPAARLPWALAGAGLATAVAVTIGLWPRSEAAVAREPSGGAAPREAGGVPREVATVPSGAGLESSSGAAAEALPVADAVEETAEPAESGPGAVEAEVERVDADGGATSGGEAEPASRPRTPRRPGKRRRRSPAKPDKDRNSLFPPGMRP